MLNAFSSDAAYGDPACYHAHPHHETGFFYLSSYDHDQPPWSLTSAVSLFLYFLVFPYQVYDLRG